METVLSNANSTAENVGVDFGWGLDSYNFPYSTSDLTRTGFLKAFIEGQNDSRWVLQTSDAVIQLRLTNNHSLGFTEAMSASTIQELVGRKHDLGATHG
jgi:hypothetical protein